MLFHRWENSSNQEKAEQGIAAYLVTLCDGGYVTREAYTIPMLEERHVQGYDIPVWIYPQEVREKWEMAYAGYTSVAKHWDGDIQAFIYYASRRVMLERQYGSLQAAFDHEPEQVTQIVTYLE